MRDGYGKIRWYHIITILYFFLCTAGCIVAYVVYHHEPTNLIVVSMLMAGFFWITDEIIELKRQIVSTQEIVKFIEEHRYDNSEKIN